MVHNVEKLYCVWDIDLMSAFWSHYITISVMFVSCGQCFIAGTRHYIYTGTLFIVHWSIEVRNRKWPIRSSSPSLHKGKNISASATWWQLDIWSWQECYDSRKGKYSVLIHCPKADEQQFFCEVWTKICLPSLTNEIHSQQWEL